MSQTQNKNFFCFNFEEVEDLKIVTSKLRPSSKIMSMIDGNENVDVTFNCGVFMIEPSKKKMHILLAYVVIFRSFKPILTILSYSQDPSHLNVILVHSSSPPEFGLLHPDYW